MRTTENFGGVREHYRVLGEVTGVSDAIIQITDNLFDLEGRNSERTVSEGGNTATMLYYGAQGVTVSQ